LIYILWGQDDYSIARAVDGIKQELGDQASLAAGTTTLENQVSPDELKTVCETMPFMTGKRLVIVNGLLGRFETQGRSRRQRKPPKTNGNQEEVKTFSNSVNAMPDTTVLVLVEGAISDKNPLLKEIAGRATVRNFPLPKEAKLREWIQKKMKDEGGSISPKAVQLLVRLVGSNLWIMASEVEKLILFTAGRTIEEEDVRAVVGYNQQATVYNMMDAILEFKAERAEQLLQHLFLSGLAPVYLLYMLARQVQLIVRAKELMRKRGTNREIQNRLGITSEYVLKKTMEQAGRYSLPRLREVYRRLLDTDLSIKTGKYDGELALNILVAELCSQGGSRPVQSRPGVR